MLFSYWVLSSIVLFVVFIWLSKVVNGPDGVEVWEMLSALFTACVPVFNIVVLFFLAVHAYRKRS